MTLKNRAAFLLVVLALGLLVVEVVLSVVHFQRRSDSPLAIIHYARRVLSRGDMAHESVGIWRPDDRLGFDHVAGASGVHRDEDFEVTYTLDETGARHVPGATDATSGSVLVVGGSFSFGHGVEDHEAWPAILATGAWSGWKVVYCPELLR